MSLPPYELLRSDRRTLSAEVVIRDGAPVLRVHAPRRLPQKDIDAFLTDRAQWIANAMSRQQERADAHPEPTEAERALLIGRARALLPGKVAAYAQQMGLTPAGITITGARTRFGSCSAQNRISFSWRLMAYPEEAIDYVVVHELSHIRYKNHSASFYALIATVLPDYQARIAMLKR